MACLNLKSIKNLPKNGVFFLLHSFGICDSCDKNEKFDDEEDDDEAKGHSQLQVLESRRDNKQEVKRRSLFAADVDVDVDDDDDDDDVDIYVDYDDDDDYVDDDDDIHVDD